MAGREAAYALTVVWLVLVLAAIGGWGAAGGWVLRRIAHVELRSLQDVLPVGVALVLAVAGIVVAFDAFSPTIVALIVGVGIGCALIELGRWALTGRGVVVSRMSALALGALLIMPVFLMARWETATFVWNLCDDDVSYLYLARRLVVDGNLLDPLNNRRLTSLGGMSALQALFLFRLPDTFLPVADLLVGSLLLLVVLWRTRSGRWSGWGIAAAFAVILFHGSFGQVNTSPILLPVGMAIAAFLFAIRVRAEAVTARAELATAAILGLLVGATATLRPQFALPLGLLALVAASWPPLGAGIIRRLTGLAVGVAAGTGGWMVASWRAVGTPMFPIFGGNLDPTWPANGSAVSVPSLHAFVGRAIHPLSSVPRWGFALLGATCLVAYVLGRLYRDQPYVRWGLRLQVAAVASCVVWMVVLAYIWWSVGSLSAYARFWAPLLMACVLLPITVVNGGKVRSTRQTAASGLAALAFVVIATDMIASPPRSVVSYLSSVATDTMSGRVNGQLDADRYATQRDEYAMAAAKVPPGSKVLAAVDVPSLLLSGGSDVDTIDLVGSTSPSPHIPYFQGTDAKLAWLRGHGYQYIIAVDPNASACLYNRPGQEQDLRGARGPQYQAWAPYFIDWFQLLGDLSSRQGTARVGSLIVAKV